MAGQAHNPAEARVETITADDLIKEAYSLLWTDQMLGKKMMPSDLEWMRKANAYLKSRSAEVPQ